MKSLRLLALVAIVFVVTASSQVGVMTPATYSPDQNVYGLSYGEWSAAWWQWALAFTNSASPVMDPNGSLCNSNQGGPVFFLAGSGPGTATRYCTVPAGKALFLPIINVECSTVEPPPFYGATGQEVRACAALWMDGAGKNTLKMTVDGKPLYGVTGYRMQSPFYSFIMPETDNYLGVATTSGWSISDGYWVMLKPLSPGQHVIHFEGALVSGPGAGGGQNITYYLMVSK